MTKGFLGKLYINGSWQMGFGTNLISTNPVNGKILWQGPTANNEDIDNAVKAARKSLPSWSALTIEERIAFLEKYTTLLEENKQDLAQTLSDETGKPLWESLTEVQGAIGKLPISIKAHAERCREFQSGPAITRFKPHGVVSIFAPFNFPLHLPNGHIIPALLAGNTLLLKPSELTPLIGEKMVLLFEKAGLPKGVLNLLQGERPTGEFLAKHPLTDGLFFTGSAQTGLLLKKALITQPHKILALEMGGNNPLIVHQSHDLETAALTIIQSAYITSGQRCTCARRLILTDQSQPNQLISILTEKIKKISVADPNSSPEPFMGSLVSEKAAKNVLAAQANLIDQGATSIIPCKLLKPGTGLLSPGLIDTTSLKNRADSETFGPLLQIIRVKDLHAAIEEANNTQYGLAAGLLADNSADFDLFYKTTRAGILNWNQPLTGASGSAPFGGLGLSGNHRPSAYFAADYCSYPVASIENSTLTPPDKLPPGLNFY